MPTLASPTPAREPARVPAAAAKSPAPSGQVIAVAGLRLYRMRSGRLIELPPDITNEEAARLEAEGAEAQKKLGRSPAPKPLADVRKPAKTETKKAQTKGAAKGAKEIRGKAAAKAAHAAAAALLGAVGSSKVAQYLSAKALPVLARGSAMLSRLSQNEQKHHDAGEKLTQSEEAVVIPRSEEQSTGNTGQVAAVSGRTTPAVEEGKATAKLAQSLESNIPRTLEDVDNFKRDQKAVRISADVMEVVQGDKNSVVTTFGDVRQTPPPVPSGHTPEQLPPAEASPRTAALNLGKGAVAPLEKEHTDTSIFTAEADGKLKEEGVTQEQLDMVDSGELADANREKKGLELKAKAEPLAVRQFAREEGARVDRDLVQEEKKGRDAIAAGRRTALGATGQKQKGTKTALEKKRDEVAAKINGMYKAAQDSVTRKLADLETASMKRFDEGNARATKAFEDNVKREFDAFKEDRYSGWFGWARKAKDWLLGMDDLPAVKAIFDRNRAAFVAAVHGLVEQITADNRRVIQQCKDELTNARKAIQEFVAGLGPSLRDIGRKAAAEMNERLNDLDQTIGRKEEELRGKLKDKQTAAIRAIDDKIAKMKEAMSGALAKLGRLLLYAAKKFFSWALGKFGVSLSTIEGIIDKGIAVLKAIFTGPIKFVKNLIAAAKTGFASFAKNFLTHLKNAVFEWLTGSLEGMTLPDTWNLRGILSVVFQLLGITYQNIRAHVVKLVPEPVVKTLETTFSLLKTLVTEGPMAAWEQLKEIAGEMRDAFVEAIKNWIKWKVVEEAVKTVLALFIPGAGIVRAVIAIYDTIVFFIQKAKQIAEMIGNFLGSIAEIAAGNIGAAAAALEDGLARGLKLVIAFLAKFLRLDGITAKIRQAIQTIRGKVDSVIEKVAGWIVGLAKKAGKLAVGAAKGAVGRLIEWWKERRSFKVDGKTHTLYFEGSKDGAKLYAQSSPGRPISEYLADLPPTTKKKPEYKRALDLAGKLEARRPKEENEEDYAPKKIAWYDDLAPLLTKLWGDEDRPPSIVTFGPLRPGVGATEMEASILTRKHEPGSKPSDSWPLWEELNPLVGDSPYYVLGHLLNENLGGKGRMFNLTPITKKANAGHSSKVETDVKKWVAAGKVVYYKVEVEHGKMKNKGDLQDTLERQSGTLSSSKKRLLAALDAERKLPRRIRFNAYMMAFRGGAWKKDTKPEEDPKEGEVENVGSAGY